MPQLKLKGSIRCNICHKPMTGNVCPCGHTHCYVCIYHDGEHLREFKAPDNYPYDYTRASARLAEINFRINEGTFSKDYLQETNPSNRTTTPPATSHQGTTPSTRSVQ